MMGVTMIPPRRVRQGVETIVMPLSWAEMFDSAEAPLSGATVPAIPTYDTAETGYPAGSVQTGTGSSTDVWWTIITLPVTYLDATDLTFKIDGIYVLSGDAVLVAATIDVEAFPYDSANGDFSNADICATAAQNLENSFGTKSFSLTGSGLVAQTPILLRFTSVIDITSAGGAGTGYNGFNFPRLEFTGRE